MPPQQRPQSAEPTSAPQNEVPLSPTPDRAQPQERPRRPVTRRRRRLRIVALLLAIPCLLCLGYWLLGFVAFSDTASLIEMKGIVQTRREQESRWAPGQMNQVLRGADRVRTGEGSGARLLFFDVSTVELYENTEVSIMRVAQRRGGNAVDVVLKTWIGKTGIRAVRFVDPSSTFRVDTPTASTVVRGARFTVEVTENGTTRIDLEEGLARVQLRDEMVTLKMGERITMQPSGAHKTETIFVPDAQPVLDKVGSAWSDPEETLTLELTESEVNRFLAAMGTDPDFFLRDTQIWFVQDEARIATTVVKPARFDLSAALGIEVVDGRLKPDMTSIAAGIALPVPDPILNLAVETILGQVEGYLVQAYSFVEFEEVQIGDGVLYVRGQKRADAPEVQ